MPEIIQSCTRGNELIVPQYGFTGSSAPLNLWGIFSVTYDVPRSAIFSVLNE